MRWFKSPLISRRHRVRRQVLRFILLIVACLMLDAGFPGNLPEVQLKFPWAGGMNSCQFGSVDINLDGKPDLVIFDRFGNRILTFINEGSGGEIKYSFHSEYASSFPDFHDWVIFADYNCDGKADIFTYSLGGTRVFRNISDTSLKFELVTNLLTSFYYTGKVGILLTPVDYPAISDIDGDGDLDLLTFFGLGSYVEYHKNLSVEKYSNCDSLDYKLSDKCWGDFKESEGGNKITLDITCPYKHSGISGLSCSTDVPRHTGSTLLAPDLNGDGLKDLVVGDIDFPNLIALMNGGTTDSAHMISQDSLFPGNPDPIRLFAFPACSFLDMDNDGIRDLVVYPFDPTLYKTENKYSCWFYWNSGTNDHPEFQFRTRNFFQNEMIDVGTNAYPVIADVNGDGLPDLLIGNYGYYDSSYYYQAVLHSVFTSRIAYYKNTGQTDNPSFHLVTDDFGGLSQLKSVAAYPAFGDLEGDGDPDMITGSDDGSLAYFQNTAGPGNEPVFMPPQLHYKGIDAGSFSAPQLFDLDRDGLLDLVIGNQEGKIVYYRNEGSVSSPLFIHITDSLGHVNVTNPVISYDGFSTPCFFRNPAGTTHLVIGCEEGKVHLYTGIDGNLEGTFMLSDAQLPGLCGTELPAGYGYRTAAAISYLQEADHPDLIAGNFSGGLNYFSGKIQPPAYTGITEYAFPGNPGYVVYPNPADREIFIQPEFRGNQYRYDAILFNALGQTVSQAASGSGHRLSLELESLPEGIYFMVISTHPGQHPTDRFTTKVIVVH
jgi:hypothetical protein